MDEDWRVFQSLEQIGFDGVLHNDGHRSSGSKIFGGDGALVKREANDDAAKSSPHVLERRR